MAEGQMDAMWSLAAALGVLAVLAAVAEVLGAEPRDDEDRSRRPMTPGGT